MSRVYDCFTFFNELDLLEARLALLGEYVDLFVIVEATKTFSGKYKPLYFLENAQRFESYRDKIKHVIVEDMPDSEDFWKREYHQRNAIMRGLEDAQDDDFVMISDVDEFPNPRLISGRKLGGYRQEMYYYWINLLTGYPWIGTAAIKYADLKTSPPQALRDHVRSNHKAGHADGGWHFSWLSDIEAMNLKLHSFSHSELNHIKTEQFQTAMSRCMDFASRNDEAFTPVHWNLLPPIVIEKLSSKYLRPLEGPRRSTSLAWSNLKHNSSDEICAEYERVQSADFTPAVYGSAVIDVVIIAWSKDEPHYWLTVRCIKSLRASNPVRLNIAVVESNPNLCEEPWISDNARPFGDGVEIIFPRESFGYNKFLKLGIKAFLGSTAQYAMILNNDVVAFCPDFLAYMLHAITTVDSVSPVGLREGKEIPPRHLALIGRDGVEGFCIMLRKSMIREISIDKLFPSELTFYFADDYYHKAVVAHGYVHALACRAECLHLRWQSQDLLSSGEKNMYLGGEVGIYKQLRLSLGESMEKFCLVTMVKNEEKIIARMIASALPVVDAIALTDTGSTDGTIEAARKAAGDVPFFVNRVQWRSFGECRTEALEFGRNTIPDGESNRWYLLLLDADHVLHVVDGATRANGFNLPPDATAVNIPQIEPSISYHNVRLVRASTNCGYIGRTHEYLNVPYVVHNDSFWIEDTIQGSNRPEKFERDEKLLRLDLKDDPNNGRAMFYLAQTLTGLGRHKEAADWYIKRVKIAKAHENEEAWCAQMRYGRCLLKFDKEHAPLQLLKAIEMRPWRAEPIKDLCAYYLDENQHAKALAWACIGRSIPPPKNDILFVETNVYRWEFDWTIMIAAYYCGMNALAECERLHLASGSPYRDMGLRNAVWYIQPIKATVSDVPFTPPDGWHACNPSIMVINHDEYRIVVRTVNYKIDDAGRYYDFGDKVRTRNWTFRLDRLLQSISNPVELKASDGTDQDARILGCEDVRVYCDESRSMRALCSRADMGGPIGIFDCAWNTETGEIIEQQALSTGKVEKNWLRGADQHWIIYSHDPFEVRDINLTKPGRKSAASFPSFRGSAGPIKWRGGWLYIVHEVTMLPGQTRRTYLHRLCWLDREMGLKKISVPFYFTHKAIEFCCGLAPHTTSVVATFGVNDGEAKMALIDTQTINDMLKEIDE